MLVLLLHLLVQVAAVHDGLKRQQLRRHVVQPLLELQVLRRHLHQRVHARVILTAFNQETQVVAIRGLLRLWRSFGLPSSKGNAPAAADLHASPACVRHA